MKDDNLKFRSVYIYELCLKPLAVTIEHGIGRF